MATPTNTATVVRLPGKMRRAAGLQATPRSPSYRRRIARQQVAAAAVAFVGIVLTALSLSHLAHGIQLVTSAPPGRRGLWRLASTWAFIALEIAQLCAVTPVVRKEISKYAVPAIVGTLIASAVMNALAFGAQATGWMLYPAVALGIAIPALIYALSRVAFGLSVAR
jgi:hypothetical protein